ncbi:2-oxoisovalerate dehydrogenase E2 component (dihydrolipoyl transacylase) [Caulobacter ginsengisoli]|uniref:Dihydrolipoamide acetyltransferase component of pyruvate dehydrogenase complex n=1 Tax=Caulobacter ginsengisoli TaxID=400775 RepID=A0ABU0IRL5_9CAUL|nr:dihydrolipoamide acetyltransferase family protein [Caulobacter ginsengisoli]MDQ0463996.1 2-oxoisovalerate dehydrogenase E2 component (dihydrolipoyl transacylase) [Caulobacter ginsengisoli]
MGRFVFKLPDLGEGTAEAEIVAWHVKIGDMVAEDAPLVDMLTDKATVEMTSPVAGKVIEIAGAPGEMAAVGGAIAVFEVEGSGNAADEASPKAQPKPVAEVVQAPPPVVEKAEAPPPAPQPTPPRQPVETVAHAIPDRAPGEKPLASPAVRRRAEDLGVKLGHVAGTGPAGRITHEDLDAFIAGARSGPAASAPTLARRTAVEEVKVIGMRRAIARQMQESKRRIPHFAYVEEVDMTELEDLRVHLNATKRADQPKLTMLPFMMRALVRVLPAYPQINARFDDEAGVVHRYAGVHIGIATQTSNGLIVPVVRHAETLDVWAAAAEVARVAEIARSGKGSKDDLSGSTITLTSLGPLGGIATTPVINHPEVAIIGPNKIVDRPVVRHGQIAVRKMMNLSSSFDHRVVDGYDAAEFIQRVKAMLEHPATLFMD